MSPLPLHYNYSNGSLHLKKKKIIFLCFAKEQKDGGGAQLENGIG